MRLIYTKPKLIDLSQGSRIAFARQFRLITQDYIAGELGLSYDNKRRIMTRYEKGNRCPKDAEIHVITDNTDKNESNE